MSRYYDRQGNPIGMMTWASMLEAGDNHVAEDWIDGVRISTVWLGLNHNFSLTGQPPLIFETMVFPNENDFIEDYCWRYSTEVQALAGHDQALALVRDALAHKC